jgi:hypothetical protein
MSLDLRLWWQLAARGQFLPTGESITQERAEFMEFKTKEKTMWVVILRETPGSQDGSELDHFECLVVQLARSGRTTK